MEEISLQRKLVTWGLTGVVLLGVGLAGQYRHLDEVPPDAVNLDKVLSVTKAYLDGGQRGFTGLSHALTRARVYTGTGPLRIATMPTGRAVAFVDRNYNGSWDRGVENDIFHLEAEKHTQRLIASDKYGNHRYVKLAQPLDKYWLTNDLIRTQVVYYGRPYVFTYYYSPYGYYGSYSWRRNVRAASIGHRGPGGHRFGK